MTSSKFCFRMQAGGKTIQSDITDGDKGCRVMIWPWLYAVRWGWAIHTTAGSLTGWGRREFLQSAPCSWGDCCQEPLGSGYGPERTERETRGEERPSAHLFTLYSHPNLCKTWANQRKPWNTYKVRATSFLQLLTILTIHLFKKTNDAFPWHKSHVFLWINMQKWATHNTSTHLKIFVTPWYHGATAV